MRVFRRTVIVEAVATRACKENSFYKQVFIPLRHGVLPGLRKEYTARRVVLRRPQAVQARGQAVRRTPVLVRTAVRAQPLVPPPRPRILGREGGEGSCQAESTHTPGVLGRP